MPAPDLPLPAAGPELPPLFLPSPIAQAAGGGLPLHGLTLLVVEDSRFACDALRLLCQRSGARMRRAETLQAARAHLKVYRPDMVIIDLGLPDGRGEGLIRELALQQPGAPVILGSSGDPAGRATALAAGAAGFLEKPLESLAVFQQALLRHLPGRPALRPDPSEPPVIPDPLALSDDLTRAARLIAANPDPGQRRYVAGFVGGLARSAHDTALEQAASSAGAESDGLARLAGLLSNRLDGGPEPFAQERRPKTWEPFFRGPNIGA